MRTRTRLLASAVLLSAVATLTGCTGGSAGQKSASDAGGSTSAGSTSVSRTVATPDRADVAPTALQTRAVVRTGELSLASKDPGAVLARVQGLLVRVGGTVQKERTTHTRSGRVEDSTLVVRVPVARFETTRRQLSRLGRVLDSTESAQDVTTRVIDNRERVRTLQTSLDRLQRFQRAATDTKDLLSIEQQITDRQAELQSLTAQRDYLASQTSMSTLTLRLTRPEVTPQTPGALDDAGFGSGLSGGWHALVAVAVVGLTGLGAAIPFAPVLALVALLAWWLRRRRSAAVPSAG